MRHLLCNTQRLSAPKYRQSYWVYCYTRFCVDISLLEAQELIYRLDQLASLRTELCALILLDLLLKSLSSSLVSSVDIEEDNYTSLLVLVWQHTVALYERQVFRKILLYEVLA